MRPIKTLRKIQDICDGAGLCKDCPYYLPDKYHMKRTDYRHIENGFCGLYGSPLDWKLDELEEKEETDVRTVEHGRQRQG